MGRAGQAAAAARAGVLQEVFACVSVVTTGRRKSVSGYAGEVVDTNRVDDGQCRDKRGCVAVVAVAEHGGDDHHGWPIWPPTSEIPGFLTRFIACLSLTLERWGRFTQCGGGTSSGRGLQPAPQAFREPLTDRCRPRSSGAGPVALCVHACGPVREGRLRGGCARRAR